MNYDAWKNHVFSELVVGPGEKIVQTMIIMGDPAPSLAIKKRCFASYMTQSFLCKNFILQNLTHCKQKHGLFGCQQNTFHCLQGKRLKLDLYWSFAVKSQQTHHDQSWKISSKILEDLQG